MIDLKITYLRTVFFKYYTVRLLHLLVAFY